MPIRGALLKLRYVIENRRGGAVVSGPAGVGKSMLTETLMRQLPDQYHPQVHLVFPQLPPEQLLAYLADELSGTQSTTASRATDVSIRRIESNSCRNSESWPSRGGCH